MTTATAKAPSRLHFELPPLPYAEDALAPVISAETLSLHHGKHHKKYIETMNELLAKSDVRGTTLEDVVRSSEGASASSATSAATRASATSSPPPPTASSAAAGPGSST